jgi:hypothetical protein
MQKLLAFSAHNLIVQPFLYGPLAQLAERLNGIEEVSSSTLLRSTRPPREMGDLPTAGRPLGPPPRSQLAVNQNDRKAITV